MLLTVLLLSACAELPLCPNPSVTVYDIASERIYIIDSANWALMARMFQGLKDGTCRVPEKIGE